MSPFGRSACSVRGVHRLAALAALVLAAAVAAPAAHAGGLKLFDTPDGNIGCAIFKGGKHVRGNVRCDINQRTWVPPARPKNCSFDFGIGATLGERGRGKYSCVSDSVIGAGPTLPAATSIRKGRFECAIEAVAGTTSWGVRCVNLGNQHGFALSPQAIGFF